MRRCPGSDASPLSRTCFDSPRCSDAAVNSMGPGIISPAILDAATRNRTDEKPNELFKQLAIGCGWEPSPAYLGLGFFLRGEAICHHHFGTLTSPRTFGNMGAGSTMFWVDPECDMTFVCLSAGVMNEAQNIARFQRLSDIAVSAAI